MRMEHRECFICEFSCSIWIEYINYRNISRLLESRDLPSEDAPLIIWFNGGPGCSSLGAFFEEFGPLYVNFDGKSLFENVNSWYHVSFQN